LDVFSAHQKFYSGGTTGDYSYVKQFKEFQIMYHVSTLLPHGESAQQLAKKRHIGNDIVLVVFQDEGCEPFSPTTVKSNYIRTRIFVAKLFASKRGGEGSLLTNIPQKLLL